MSIHTVPPEILAHIFKATFFSHLDQVSISPRSGPLLVAQVSRFWRHVAISDSGLWASLRVNISHTTILNYPSIVEIWLQRSLCQPLSITLHIDPFSHLDPQAQKIVQDILRLLSAHAHRWKSLSVSLPANGQLLTELCSSDAPLLESLSFKLGNWSEEEATCINNLFLRAPALHDLQWSNRSSWSSWDAPFDSGMQHLQVAWSNLTDILLDTWVTLQTALDILVQCDALVNLDMRHFSYSPELLFESDSSDQANSNPLTPPPYIRLPRLQSIAIYQLKLDEGISALMDRIITPNLLHFNFTCGFVDQTRWPQTSFHNLLARSACQLQSLMLEYTGITQDELIQCLQDSSPSLARLGVHDARGDICVGDKLLEMLRISNHTPPSKGSTPFCSKLDTFVLHRVIECSDGALTQTLQSRTATGTSAQTDFGDQIQTPRCVPLRHIDVIFSKKYLRTNEEDIRYLENSCHKDIN